MGMTWKLAASTMLASGFSWPDTVSPTRLGIGLIPFMNLDAEAVDATVRRALDLGWNVVDFSRVYGSAVEKAQHLLRPEREQLFLAGKVYARHAERAREHLEGLLRGFGTDHFDLLSLHDVSSREEFDLVMGEGGAMELLREAKQKGQALRLGMTGHWPPALLHAAESEEFDAITGPLNPCCLENLGIMQRAAAAGKMVLAIKTLGNGRIFGPEPLGAVGEAEITPADSLQFVLSQGCVTTAVVGCKSPDEVSQANEAAMNNLDVHGKAQIQEMGFELLAGLCGFCHAPCQAVCEPGVPIQYILRRWRNFERINYDIRRLGDEYDLLRINSTACTDCGRCEAVCPASLDITGRLKAAHDTLADGRRKVAFLEDNW